MNSLTQLLIKSQKIDRRFLYLLLVMVLAAPFLTSIPVPPPVVSPPTQSFYDTIEDVAKDPAQKDKLTIVCANFDSGTSADNLTQTEALIRHLMQKHLKFAIFNFTAPQGTELVNEFMQEEAPKTGYVYGKDYINWGFRPSAAIVNLLKAAVRDIPGTFLNDYNGKPLSSFPIMQNVKTVDDINLIVECTASDSLGTWLQYYQRAGKEPIPTLYCPTRVMAPQAFPLLKSGQIQGMLSGLNGTVEYEKLINEKGFATQASASLSYSTLLIVLLIILGNVGMFAANRESAKSGGGR